MVRVLSRAPAPWKQYLWRLPGIGIITSVLLIMWRLEVARGAGPRWMAFSTPPGRRHCLTSRATTTTDRGRPPPPRERDAFTNAFPEEQPRWQLWRNYHATRLSATPTSPTTPASSTTSVVTAEQVMKVPPEKFVPHPFHYQQEMDLYIETLTNRGMGLGRVALTAEQIQNVHFAANNNNSQQPDHPRRNARNKRRAKRNAEQEEAESLLLAAAFDNERHHANDGDASSSSSSSSSSSASTSEQQQQWVVMVPSVIPGERVRVRIFRNYKKYSQADLVKVLEPHPTDRTQPQCTLAGVCGGCQMQHMTIASQRRWKTRHVQDALRQFQIDGYQKALVVQPCLGTNHIYAYRSKLTPHYSEPSRSRRGQHNEKKTIESIGFQKQATRQLVDVEQCPIATPAVNRAYAQLRAELLASTFDNNNNSKRGGTLLLRQARLDSDHVETSHQALLTTPVNGLNFTYRANNFFQNNYHVLPLMVDHVVSQAAAGGAMTHLVDCYCGSGLFALSAAARFHHVVGIEINDKAIVEAQANAVANRIANSQFLAASAEGIFDVIGNKNFPRHTTAVVLDPPRKGCSNDFLQQLLTFAPARIVYLSCDPTTQARDAATLVQDEQYEIKSVQPFDLFPQTRHIECLMILERRRHETALSETPGATS